MDVTTEVGIETEAIGVIVETEETEETEEIGGIGVCHAGMLDATTMIDHQDGREICSRVESIVVAVVEEEAVEVVRYEVIVTNLPSKWVLETGRRAPVLRPRKKSLRQT